jgi:hypothetical protein
MLVMDAYPRAHGPGGGIHSCMRDHHSDPRWKLNPVRKPGFALWSSISEWTEGRELDTEVASMLFYLRL